MPKYHFFSILTCMACLFYISCERTGYTVNKNDISDSERIINREVEECEDCPNEDDCCCGIELVNLSPGVNLRLCGTADGASACSASSAPSPCSNVIGGGQVKFLDEDDQKLLFCMVKGNTLSVTNNSGSFAIIRITCQYDVTNPQTVLDTILSTETHYYLINNGCVTDECEL